MSHSTDENVFLVWGGNGWIAGHVVSLLKQQGKTVHTTTVRKEDRFSVMSVLETVRPSRVLDCAGYSGRWCDDNKAATIRSNVIGTLTLVDVCDLRGIHITVFSTGSFYRYDIRRHCIGGVGFDEYFRPNFQMSFYSDTQWKVQEIMKNYKNVLCLRLRMPVSDDLHPRSFSTEITNSELVLNIPNSITILHDLIPAAVFLAEKNETGVYNFTNPGVISHDQVLSLFKKIVRPSLTWRNYPAVEQDGLQTARGRSDCQLDVRKLISTLAKYGFGVPEIHESYEQCLMRMVVKGVK